MSIEKGPSGPEKTPEELISEFKNDFEKWMVENPDIAEEMKQGVLSMAGVEEHELDKEEMKEMGYDYSYAVTKIPIEQLGVFGTSCGDVPNRPFSREIIDFLKSKKVEFIIALSFDDEPKICSVAVRLDEKSGDKLGKMVDKNGGSLRCEASRVEGWSVFESE